MTHHFVGTLPKRFIFWNVQDNSFTFYHAKYSGYIGVSRYTLTALPMNIENAVVKRDPLREKFGFTELMQYGHFFFCQTKYSIPSYGQILAGLTTYPIPVTPLSVHLYGPSIEELFQSLNDTQTLFSRHPDLPFILAAPVMMQDILIPSAPPAEPLLFYPSPSPSPSPPPSPSPSPSPSPLPLPTERLALSLARDSIQQKEICLITQEALTSGEIAVTACHCVFQAPLLTQWATTHTTCPGCRSPLAFRIVTV